jgi:hypothetical protein
MGNATGNVDEVEQIASQDIFVDLQADLHRQFGEEGTWRLVRGVGVCSRAIRLGDGAGGLRGCPGVGQAPFALCGKRANVILP